MAPFNDVADDFKPQWNFASSLPEREEIGDKFSVKGSQFQKPLLEFSGACAGKKLIEIMIYNFITYIIPMFQTGLCLLIIITP